MSGLQGLKAFISQRLTAAVDDVLGHLERTFREYEEETERRHRDLLEVFLTAEMKQRGAVCPSDVQQIVVNVEKQQKRSSSLDQEDAHIKEEQEELWSSQETDITEFPSSPVPVKREDDEEKPESSQLHHSHTEENRDSVGESEPEPHLQPVTGDKASDSEPETEISDDDCKQSREPEQDSVQHHSTSVNEGGKKLFICSECGRKFGRKDSLRRHMRYHTGEKPYSCSVCSKRFSQRPNLIRHMRCHSGEKPFGCSFCETSFAVRSALVNHMRIHTGEKPFSCLYCEKSFTQKGGLKKHMTVHTGEKPYSCPVCEKSFSQKANLTYHFSVHTGQKQFGCSICDKRFTWQSQVKSHKCVGESSS
ncbi:zinc finger protein 32-like [Amphiprion ocellaris]|uniref:C2H2-type domain-containing protein n=2 Tax=Amphiprion ocellaris TaxID=80972 RepID=A0A3Q1AQQ6_AMPOC|nr:zinc finger protein 32-like [Amphiprion ocellaris]